MSILSGYSTKTNISQAIADLQGTFPRCSPELVIYFASAAYNMSQLAAEMQLAFPSAALIGCSTAGEIVSGKMLKHALVAMSFTKNTLEDVAVAVVENVHEPQSLEKAIRSIEEHYKMPLMSFDIEKHAGIILVDGLSNSEEKLMNQLGVRSDIFFVGGSAGDDLGFKHTVVSANGKVYEGAAVLAVLKLPMGFGALKTQSFSDTGKRLVATRVDEEKRTVFEFNGRPALQAYAEALDTTPADAPNHFMHSPLGLLVDGEPYVRSPQQVRGDQMVFYCNIKKGTEMAVLSSGDIVAKTRKDLELAIEKDGPFTGILNFNCILRTLELEQKDQCQAYANLFTHIPTAGFSTYGEEYIGHINQTATMLLFK